jgi:hypothetical protein
LYVRAKGERVTFTSGQPQNVTAADFLPLGTVVVIQGPFPFCCFLALAGVHSLVRKHVLVQNRQSRSPTMGGGCGCYSVRHKFSTTVPLSTEPTTERAGYAALVVQNVNSILMASCAAEKSTSQPLGESRSKRFRLLAFVVRIPASRRRDIGCGALLREKILRTGSWKVGASGAMQFI